MPRVSHYLGRWIRAHRLVPGLSAAPLRSPRRRAGTAAACTSRSSCKAARAGPSARTSCSTIAYRDISDHLATIDRYTTLAAEQWRAEGRRTNALAGRRPSAARVPPQLHPARRLQGRRGRPARVGAELVLRLPEAGEALGAAAATSHHRPHVRPSSQRSATPDVLAPHRHRADLARRPEPGAASRCWACARSGTGRCSSRTPAASCGSARRKGSTSIPLAPKTEMDLSAAWRLSRAHQAAAARHRPRARSARRRDGGAGAVDEHAARRSRRSSRRGASTSTCKGNALSRWKYRQVDCFICASEAIRQMLVADGVPARAGGDRARRHRPRARRRGAAGEPARGAVAAAPARRSSATSPRWCRTRGSAT